ncbi:MAG: hypothetical protein ACTSU5_21065 [Promethearchaeota archaeon]
MSEGIFGQLKEGLEEVMAGRKYLISSIKKLETTVKKNIDVGPTIDKLREALEKAPDFSAISALEGKLDQVVKNLGKFDLLVQAQDDMRRSVNDLSNTLLQIRPIVDAVHNKIDQQSQVLAGINQGMQQLGQLMGQILAKLG